MKILNFLKIQTKHLTNAIILIPRYSSWNFQFWRHFSWNQIMEICNLWGLWFSESDHMLWWGTSVLYTHGQYLLSFATVKNIPSNITSACSCLLNSFTHSKSLKLCIHMVVGLEKLFSFVLDHRNWMLELLFLASAAICVSNKCITLLWQLKS